MIKKNWKIIIISFGITLSYFVVSWFYWASDLFHYAYESTIKGIIDDSNDDDEECVANINGNQFIVPHGYINFDDLLKF